MLYLIIGKRRERNVYPLAKKQQLFKSLIENHFFPFYVIDY